MTQAIKRLRSFEYTQECILINYNTYIKFIHVSLY